MLLRLDIPPFLSGRLLRSFVQLSRFHASVPLAATHYDLLSLPHSATRAEVKKRFYELSKKCHPDRHPNDPEAARRFVGISSAYAILGNAEKREKYDKGLRQELGGNIPPGSRASHRGPVGARPATGLSRRRTQFHGPPPSFYKNGGWGSSGKSSRRSGSGYAGGGIGDLGGGIRDDVPHFDFDAKHRQHLGHEERLASRFKGRRVSDDRGIIFPLLGVTTILLVVASAASFGQSARDRKHPRV